MSKLHPDDPAFAGLLNRIHEGVAERERARQNPFEQVGWLAESGFGTLRLLPSAGGFGLSLQELLSAVIDLAAVDSNIAHALRSHFLITESRRHLKDDRWNAAAARGELFGIATAERGTSRIDSRDYATKLTPADGGWVLNGEKIYSTGSIYADWLQVPAALPDGSLQTVFVEGRGKGVEHLDDWDGFGQRLTGSGTTIFRSVFIPAAHGTPWRGQRDGEQGHVQYRGTFAQLYLLATLAGIIEGVAADIAAVVRGRNRSFTHASAEKPGNDPLVQHVAGQIDGFAYVARSAVLQAADSLDIAASSQGEDGNVDPALGHEAALNVARIKAPLEDFATRASTLLFEAGGASTTGLAKNLDRHWRNARTVASHNPTIFKTRAVGDHLINGTPIPANGFF